MLHNPLVNHMKKVDGKGSIILRTLESNFHGQQVKNKQTKILFFCTHIEAKDPSATGFSRDHLILPLAGVQRNACRKGP